MLVRPGGLVVTEFGRTNRQMNAGPCAATALYLPMEAVEALLPRPLRVDGLAIREPFATLLRGHAEGLARALVAGTPAEAAPGLAQETLHPWGPARC